jgi:hypothetical protein
MRNAYKIFVRKIEDNRPLCRSGRRWEDNIRMDLKGSREEVVDWIRLVQNRDQWRVLLNTVMNFCFYKRWGIS